MMETAYGLKLSMPIPYTAAVARTTEALKEHGFGVLTTIDMQHAMKEKLDRTFREYIILGACNPSLAHRALETDLDIGLLLPCNVIVYETGPGTCVVAAMAPKAALGLVGDSAALSEVAIEADTRLRAALSDLEASVSHPLLTP
jgi:Uncharacterized conserved protein